MTVTCDKLTLSSCVHSCVDEHNAQLQRFLYRAKDMLYKGVEDLFKQRTVCLHLHRNHQCVLVNVVGAKCDVAVVVCFLGVTGGKKNLLVI